MKTINLQAESGHRKWTVYNSGTTYWRTPQFFEAVIGNLPVNDEKFAKYQIVDISEDEITIVCKYGYGLDEKYTLTPGKSIVLSYDVEGREWSDGCSYDGDTYILKLTWK